MRTGQEHAIDVLPERCTGCRRCQLICSFLHDGEFNPSRARIAIEDRDEGVDQITFMEECDRCGACVTYCAYGALRFRRKE